MEIETDSGKKRRYNFKKIEKKWQDKWDKDQLYKAVDIPDKDNKFYILVMFAYPSGDIHIGHFRNYIVGDAIARYQMLNGKQVLHPFGWDAFGLPAERAAIKRKLHPDNWTYDNIDASQATLKKVGISFDWSREVVSCSPDYYKWTQWTFIQLFNSWFNNQIQKAEPIKTLIDAFEKDGNTLVDAACDEIEAFTASEWKSMNEKEQQLALMNYRLAHLSDTMVNWCPELGTVLANDEVKEGYSERGGHPVERKLMKQWSLRITAYAQRLLDGLDTINWSDSLKEIQRNWIGRSEGSSVLFSIEGFIEKIEVFTTRPDTLFGATYMVLAPEHELVAKITTNDYSKTIKKYIKWATNRSERERIADVKSITGEFTGAYAINPVNDEKIPIWVADYVLAGYGTGAIMAVPGHDSRDFAFARNFKLPIIQVVVKKGENPTDPASWEESYDSKEGFMINSGFINGMEVKGLNFY